jgi:hypothetical protein
VQVELMVEYERLLRLRAADGALTAEDLASLEIPDEDLQKQAFVFSFKIEKFIGPTPQVGASDSGAPPFRPCGDANIGGRLA